LAGLGADLGLYLNPLANMARDLLKYTDPGYLLE